MHRNPSVMKHSFAQVPRAEIPRSSFDRSHGHKTTFDAGYLVPILLDEALPGDTFNCRMTGFARLATPIYPIMDNMFMDTHFFAVPIRLVWENWVNFNGEQRNPGDSTDYLVPVSTSPATTGYAAGSLQDYMGIPPGVPNLQHSSLWCRAYNLIYNEWFRDQNLQNSLTVPLFAGPDDPTYYTLRRRGKRHDYFTSCLPWPQKGPGVALPLGATAPVTVDTVWTNDDLQNLGTPFVQGSPPTGGGWITGQMGATPPSGANGVPVELRGVADLSSASAATINSLRQAFQVQKIYERDARGGTRYTELIKAHFGVTSPDARLQRPEYLGGGSTPINISPIPQTSATGAYADSPQGNLAAMGTALLNNHGFTTSFTEHCLILGLVSVRADQTYQQGLNRMFSRRSRFDFYWPALSHIGEQAVLEKEIYATGVPAQDDGVFGYQERYAEYRYKPSIITGLFRSSHPQSLDAWHLSQDWPAAPQLNEGFIVEDPPVDRVIAVQDEPHFLFDAYFSMRCARPMPVYGVPGLMDHF